MISQNNINKFTSFMTLLLVVFSLISISTIKSFAEVGDVIEEGNFKFTVLDKNSVSLTDVIDKAVSGEQIIPQEVDGKKVIEIGDSAFYRCQQMTSIKIPNTITSIGNSAFESCSKLKQVDIPDSVTKIGKLTFGTCSKMTEVKLSKSLTEIPQYAFSGCKALKSIEIPDGVTEIGIFAFTNCRVLEEATIPKSITNPYLTGQFSDCRALKTIKGYKGSAARTFSRIGGYNFIALDAVEGEEQLEVKFDPDNGDAVVSQPVYKDEILNYTPGKITKKGYTFVGWYENTDNITTEYKNNQTYTKNVTYTAKWAHFEGLGAQVKVDKTGIRFGTKLYNDGDEVIEKGTVMIPTKLIDTTTQWIITLDTENSVRSIGKVNYEVNKDENYVVYLGTLINIPESQRDTYIRTSSYVKYKDKFGNEYIVYAFNKEASINSLLESSN